MCLVRRRRALRSSKGSVAIHGMRAEGLFEEWRTLQLMRKSKKYAKKTRGFVGAGLDFCLLISVGIRSVASI